MADSWGAPVGGAPRSRRGSRESLHDAPAVNDEWGAPAPAAGDGFGQKGSSRATSRTSVRSHFDAPADSWGAPVGGGPRSRRGSRESLHDEPAANDGWGAPPASTGDEFGQKALSKATSRTSVRSHFDAPADSWGAPLGGAPRSRRGSRESLHDERNANDGWGAPPPSTGDGFGQKGPSRTTSRTSVRSHIDVPADSWGAPLGGAPRSRCGSRESLHDEHNANDGWGAPPPSTGDGFGQKGPSRATSRTSVRSHVEVPADSWGAPVGGAPRSRRGSRESLHDERNANDGWGAPPPSTGDGFGQKGPSRSTSRASVRSHIDVPADSWGAPVGGGSRSRRGSRESLHDEPAANDGWGAPPASTGDEFGQKALSKATSRTSVRSHFDALADSWGAPLGGAPRSRRGSRESLHDEHNANDGWGAPPPSTGDGFGQKGPSRATSRTSVRSHVEVPADSWGAPVGGAPRSRRGSRESLHDEHNAIDGWGAPPPSTGDGFGQKGPSRATSRTSVRSHIDVPADSWGAPVGGAPRSRRGSRENLHDEPAANDGWGAPPPSTGDGFGQKGPSRATSRTSVCLRIPGEHLSEELPGRGANRGKVYTMHLLFTMDGEMLDRILEKNSELLDLQAETASSPAPVRHRFSPVKAKLLPLPSSLSSTLTQMIDSVARRRGEFHSDRPRSTRKRPCLGEVPYYAEDDDVRTGVQPSHSSNSVVDNTPPTSAGFVTPKSRTSRESFGPSGSQYGYELSMQSPGFNQTQFRREEFEAAKASRCLNFGQSNLPFSPPSVTNTTAATKITASPSRAEISTQTGQSLARGFRRRPTVTVTGLFPPRPVSHGYNGEFREADEVHPDEDRVFDDEPVTPVHQRNQRRSISAQPVARKRLPSSIGSEGAAAREMDAIEEERENSERTAASEPAWKRELAAMKRGVQAKNINGQKSDGLPYSTAAYREQGRIHRGATDTMTTKHREHDIGTSHGGTGGGSSPHFSPANLHPTGKTVGKLVAAFEARDGKKPVRVPTRGIRPLPLATSTPMKPMHTSLAHLLRAPEVASAMPPVGRAGEGFEDDSFLSTISGNSGGSGRHGITQPEYKKQIQRMKETCDREAERIEMTTKSLIQARRMSNGEFREADEVHIEEENIYGRRPHETSHSPRIEMIPQSQVPIRRKSQASSKRDTLSMQLEGIDEENIHGQIDAMFDLDGEEGHIEEEVDHGIMSGNHQRRGRGQIMRGEGHGLSYAGDVPIRRESTMTIGTGVSASGLAYSTSVYREQGRIHRGATNTTTTTYGEHHDIGTSHGGTSGGSSPHFSPANYRPTGEAAGQRVAAYEAREGKKPVRVPTRGIRPFPQASSTPMGSVHSSLARHGHLLSAPEVSKAMAPVGTAGEVVEDDSFLSTISGNSGGSGRHGSAQAEYKKQIQRMKETCDLEAERIQMTTKSLMQARKKSQANNELRASRTLLVTKLRVAALKREQQRLSAFAIVRNPPPPVSKSVLGAMDISDITIHLNRNLCARPQDGGSSTFAFLVVLKCGVEVEATAPQLIAVGNRPSPGLKVVHFPEHLRFSNLPVDFTIRLEVYVMKLREKKEETCGSVIASKARNLLVPSPRRAIAANPASPSVSGEFPIGELVRCGYTALDRDTAGAVRLYLDGAEYPLEGTIELASRCTRLPSAVEVDFRGFLTMYKVVGGFGSWVRYWAVLRRGVVCFWRSPDDEMHQRGPITTADLSKCTDAEIVGATREVCSRQFAFSIDMLVETTPSIVEKKRVLLAADSREQQRAWMSAINETLLTIRA